MEPREEKEMNLFDLMRLFFKWVGKMATLTITLSGSMVRLIFQKFWIISIVIILGVAVGLYDSRPSNRIYKAEALLHLNVPEASTVQELVRQVANSFPSNMTDAQKNTLAHKLDVTEDIVAGIYDIKSFFVIDFLNDSTPDMVDFSYSHDLTDTLNIRSRKYLYMQIRTKNIKEIDTLGSSIIRFLNQNEILQRAYISQKRDLEELIESCNKQIGILDSLSKQSLKRVEQIQQVQFINNTLVVGEQRIQLYHNELILLTNRRNSFNAQLVKLSDPIVVPSGFIVDPEPINSRKRNCIMGLVLGALLGILIAFVEKNFKQMMAFLRIKE